MLTTLGCSGTPDPRNSSVDKFLKTPWGEIDPIPVDSAQGALDQGIPQLGDLSTEEFLRSGVPGHPRVVRIQGWFLAGPTLFRKGSHAQLSASLKTSRIVQKTLGSLIWGGFMGGGCPAPSSVKTTTKPYSEPIQPVLTTSPNCTWKQLLSFSVGSPEETLWKLTRFRCWEEAKLGVSHFFRERSRLCRGPFRDCSS